MIREKSTMVIPEDRDGRMGLNPDLAKDTSARVEQEDSSADNNSSSRQGAGQKQASRAVKVIVDMREFRYEKTSKREKKKTTLIWLTSWQVRVALPPAQTWHRH